MTLPASSSLVERVAAAIQSRDHASLRRANVDAYYVAARAAIAVVVAEAAKVCKDECRSLYRRKALIEGGVAATLEHKIRRLSPTPKDDA